MNDFETNFLITYFNIFDKPTIETKVKLLNKCLEYCNIFSQFDKNDNNEIIIIGKNLTENDIAAKLKIELEKCWPLGQVEWEKAKINKTLNRFKQSYILYRLKKFLG